jgi:hypothetical protein
VPDRQRARRPPLRDADLAVSVHDRQLVELRAGLLDLGLPALSVRVTGLAAHRGRELGRVEPKQHGLDEELLQRVGQHRDPAAARESRPLRAHIRAPAARFRALEGAGNPIRP